MKYIKLYILVLIACLTKGLPLQGMLTSKYTSLKRAAARKVAVTRAAQKRTLYTPEKLKGLYAPLTTEAKKVSPLHGAIEFETKAIERRYNVESQAFGPQLVKELFFQQGPQFRPTVSKSKAAYSLSPEILGLVIGALETGRLQETTVREYIINQWTNEYGRITEEKKPFSRGKIEKLLVLIENAYNEDKDNCRGILLGFLYAKALPDNDHDMIHYLAGLNEFINVFSDQDSYVAESVRTYADQKKGFAQLISNTQQAPTFFGQLKSAVNTIKNYISGGSDSGASNVYQQKDYSDWRWALEKTLRPKAVEEAINEKFELTVSAMLDKKRNRSVYPAKVVLSSYGYEGKPSAPNCVEAAIQDLFNIILYNPALQSFDLSLLPSTLPLNEDFRKFYNKYDLSKINTRDCGQAFMDLVSGKKEKIDIKYNRDNYELAAAKSDENLLKLANFFLGSKAQNFNELGALLSNKNRTITFSEPIIKDAFSHEKVITIIINNKQPQVQLKVNFCFRPGHGFLEVPDRDVEKIRKSLFTAEELAKSGKVNPKVQALLRIEPIDPENLMRDYSSTFYYALPTESNNDKIKVIKIISNMSPEKISEEAVDYAFHLYQQLSPSDQEYYVPIILKDAIKNNTWLLFPKFKKILIKNYKEALLTASVEIPFREYIDFINEVFKELPGVSKEQFLMDVLKNTNISIVTTAFIITLCDQITDKIQRREFFKNLLDSIARETIYVRRNEIDFTAIIELLLEEDNAFFIDTTDEYKALLLSSAIQLRNTALIELLIKKGIPADISLEYEKGNKKYKNITSLGIILEREDDIGLIKFLLQHGANPNALYRNFSGEFGPVFMLMTFNRWSGEDVFKLLLQYGANILASNSRLQTILDIFDEQMKAYNTDFIKEMRKRIVAAGAKTSAELLKGNIEESVTEDKQKQLNIE